MYAFRDMYSFRMSFWSVPLSLARGMPRFSAATRYMAKITAAVALTVKWLLISSSGIPSKIISMSSTVSMATPTLPTSGSATRIVRVVAHLRRQVQGYAETGLAPLQQESKTLVRLFRGAESRVLADGPESAAVHRRVDPSSKRVGAGEAQPLQVPAVRAVQRSIHGLQGQPGFGGRLLAVFELAQPALAGLQKLVRRVIRVWRSRYRSLCFSTSVRMSLGICERGVPTGNTFWMPMEAELGDVVGRYRASDDDDLCLRDRSLGGLRRAVLARARCAPERTLRPTTSTSFCRAMLTMDSTVWCRPV